MKNSPQQMIVKMTLISEIYYYLCMGKESHKAGKELDRFQASVLVFFSCRLA